MIEVIIDDKIYKINKINNRNFCGRFPGNKYDKIKISRIAGEFQCKIRCRKDRDMAYFTFTSGSQNIEGKYIFEGSASEIEKFYLRPSIVIVKKVD